MTVIRVSDPTQWCFAEIDETVESAEGIDRLLAALDDDGESGSGSEALAGAVSRRAAPGRALEAIEVLESSLTGPATVVPARHLIDPVLELWELADDIDPAVAAPIEALLVHLTGRRRTTTDEVRAALSEAVAALADVARVP